MQSPQERDYLTNSATSSSAALAPKPLFRSSRIAGHAGSQSPPLGSRPRIEFVSVGRAHLDVVLRPLAVGSRCDRVARGPMQDRLTGIRSSLSVDDVAVQMRPQPLAVPGVVALEGVHQAGTLDFPPPMDLVFGAGRIDRRITDVESLLCDWRVKEMDYGQLYLEHQPSTSPNRVLVEDLAVTMLVNSRVDARQAMGVSRERCRPRPERALRQ